MGHLSGRRGKISGSESRAGSVVVKAQVPLSEMLSYANELISMTQGRGSYSMEFSHYDLRAAGNRGKGDCGSQAAPRGRARSGNSVD